jgi:hypothetical protein
VAGEVARHASVRFVVDVTDAIETRWTGVASTFPSHVFESEQRKRRTRAYVPGFTWALPKTGVGVVSVITGAARPPFVISAKADVAVFCKNGVTCGTAGLAQLLVTPTESNNAWVTVTVPETVTVTGSADLAGALTLPE